VCAQTADAPWANLGHAIEATAQNVVAYGIDPAKHSAVKHWTVGLCNKATIVFFREFARHPAAV